MIHKIYGEILKFTLAEIISATGAKLIWGEEISGEFEISTDTRTIKENDIYLEKLKKVNDEINGILSEANALTKKENLSGENNEEI